MTELSGKTFIGPQLRKLRRSRNETQAQVAKNLGISPAYVNLLESNQRSLSVKMLMRLSEVYNVDWRDLVKDDSAARVDDLRRAFKDPIFGIQPDLQELRAAVDHCPTIVQSLMTLQTSYRRLSEEIMRDRAETRTSGIIQSSPEGQVHDVFRENRNHFPKLEEAAENLGYELSLRMDDAYVQLKGRLAYKSGITTKVLKIDEMNATLRAYDEESKTLALSEALDHQNKIFQLAHMICLVEYADLIDDLISARNLSATRAGERLRVELANYFAAALLMPYARFLKNAQDSQYNLELLAARFDTSVEQVAHRLTTLQRDGARGVPFFFLRVDKAGNVTKRFNATSFQLAEYGGACPAWNLHTAFRAPGQIIPQKVALPDGEEFFTMSVTTERPYTGATSHESRLVIAIGCPIEYLDQIHYARQAADKIQPIGINCHLCPRQQCAHRAHQALHIDLPIDPLKRGSNRYES